MRSLQHYRTWQHQINFILLSSSNTVHRFISILLKRMENPFTNKDSRFCVLWNVTAVSYAGTDKKNDAWKHCVSTVSLSVSGENGPITARYANYELSFRLMSDKRLCHSEAVHQRGMNVTAFGSNSSHAGGVVVIQRDRHENPTARLRAFLKEGFRLLCIVFYPFSPVCVAPAFLYISWPLSRHHSCLIGRAGGSSSGSPRAHVSSGRRGGKTTTQHLQSPELIYAAAVSKTPSLWHCCSRNQHRLLPSLHASLAVVGNPFRWSLTTRFCIG